MKAPAPLCARIPLVVPIFSAQALFVLLSAFQFLIVECSYVFALKHFISMHVLFHILWAPCKGFACGGLAAAMHKALHSRMNLNIMTTDFHASCWPGGVGGCASLAPSWGQWASVRVLDFSFWKTCGGATGASRCLYIQT
jgi:hypothetical protein